LLPAHIIAPPHATLTHTHTPPSLIHVHHIQPTRYVPNTRSALGVPSVTSGDTSGVAAAAAMASTVDAVVVALGSDLSIAAEGHDAVDLFFSPAQLTLVAAVAAAAKRPITVVTLTAVPFDITPLLVRIPPFLPCPQEKYQTHPRSIRTIANTHSPTSKHLNPPPHSLPTRGRTNLPPPRLNTVRRECLLLRRCV